MGRAGACVKKYKRDVHVPGSANVRACRGSERMV